MTKSQRSTVNIFQAQRIWGFQYTQPFKGKTMQTMKIFSEYKKGRKFSKAFFKTPLI